MMNSISFSVALFFIFIIFAWSLCLLFPKRMFKLYSLLMKKLYGWRNKMLKNSEVKNNNSLRGRKK